MLTRTETVGWTAFGPFALGGTDFMAIQDPVFWRGSWYAYTGSGQVLSNNARILVWSPGTGTMSTISFSAQPRQAEPTLCVFNDRLFLLKQQTPSTAQYELWEITGGTMTLKITFSLAPDSPAFLPNDHIKFAMFVDGANLICCLPAALNTGGPTKWKVFAVDSALVATDISTTVDLTTVFGVPALTGRVGAIVDIPESIGVGSPDIYLGYAADGNNGTSISWAKWNGIASPVTGVGTGGNVQHALPWGVQNGGSVFWTSGQRHVERISALPVDGGVRWGFKIYSPNPSVDAVSVRWIVTNAVGEYPTTPYATLSNPSVGTLSAGNTQIDGLDAADNGVTTFFVTWLAQTDGFSNGDLAKTTPEIFA
jgi:hypothetical protein